MSNSFTYFKEHKKTEDLTRFAIQAKGPNGKWTRKPFAYAESNNIHLRVARPPCVTGVCVLMTSCPVLGTSK